jgi:hypothetical protein
LGSGLSNSFPSSPTVIQLSHRRCLCHSLSA